MNSRHYKKSFGEKMGDVFVYAVIILLTAIFLYPMVNTLALSLSDTSVLKGGNVTIWPKGFTLDSYRYLLGISEIYRYYGNTILYAGLGTFITIFFTSLMAYPLSDAFFSGKKVLGIYLTITMFIGGGLVPTYLLFYRLGLIDTVWAMVLPGIGAYNIMVYKTFFKGIPDSLKEAAKMDGAGHFRILFTIILPLSKPLLATMSLFSIVGHWNGYFSAVLYLNNQEKHPIQMFLRRLLIMAQVAEDSSQLDLGVQVNAASRTVQAAAIMIAMTPILCVYPFAQKYFAKGVLVGSVKG